MVVSGCGAASRRPVERGIGAAVARDAFIVGAIDGRLLEVRAGRQEAVPIATLTNERFGILDLDLSPDRRTAYAAVGDRDCQVSIVRVDVVTGSTRRLAAGSALALSPEGSRLAILREPRTGGCSQEGRYPQCELVIRDLATSRERVVGVPVVSAVVGLGDCCIGLQHLLAEDLASGAERPFAEIEAPSQTLRRRQGTSQIVFVTALRRAWFSDGGPPMLVRSGVTAAAG
ncbi:MAG: hypothetical protein JO087_03550 [Actinobacteria bacterium]|nr:hypothetical protein [Actinomycetota bacterium]